MQKRFLLIGVVALALLSGCLRPYTPTIQQGNVITQDMVSRLKVGMTQNEVQFILGTPVLHATFEDHRWDYIYTYKPKNHRETEEKRLSVYFNDDGRVVKIQNELVPHTLKNT